MKALQAGLIMVMVGMWIRSAYKWFRGVAVSPPYYFFSMTLSLIICIAVIVIEIVIQIRISTNHNRHTR